jgi:hypothetical protein
LAVERFSTGCPVEKPRPKKALRGECALFFDGYGPPCGWENRLGAAPFSQARFRFLSGWLIGRCWPDAATNGDTARQEARATPRAGRSA